MRETRMDKWLKFYQDQDRVLSWSIIISSISALIILGLLILNLTRLPAQLPLFYSLPWGEQQLASPAQFAILPAMVVLINLINLVISWHLHPSQVILKRILSGSAAVVAMLLLATTLKIVAIFI